MFTLFFLSETVCCHFPLQRSGEQPTNQLAEKKIRHRQFRKTPLGTLVTVERGRHRSVNWPRTLTRLPPPPCALDARSVRHPLTTGRQCLAGERTHACTATTTLASRNQTSSAVPVVGARQVKARRTNELEKAQESGGGAEESTFPQAVDQCALLRSLTHSVRWRG